MYTPQITYLTIVWAVFIEFVLLVSFHKPKGPLLSTYGHLQAMADIADVRSKKMYWGDKGEIEGEAGIRHAGTSDTKLPPVITGELYS